MLTNNLIHERKRAWRHKRHTITRLVIKYDLKQLCKRYARDLSQFLCLKTPCQCCADGLDGYPRVYQMTLDAFVQTTSTLEGDFQMHQTDLQCI